MILTTTLTQFHACIYMYMYMYMYMYLYTCIYNVHVHVHVLMSDERRKKERSTQGQTNKQGKTPKAVTFSKKNELPYVHVQSCIYI